MDSTQIELLPGAVAGLVQRSLHPRFRGFAVLDLETSGLSPETDQILEIGLVLLSRSFGVETKWSQMVNPGPGQGVGPSHIHHIFTEDVCAAPSFQQISSLLRHVLKDRIVICHNSGFDVGFLRVAFTETSATVSELPALCTLTDAKSMMKTPSRALTACCDFAGITLAHHHRALHDAEATARLAATYLALAASDCQLPAESVPVDALVGACAGMGGPEMEPSVKEPSVKDLMHFQSRLPRLWSETMQGETAGGAGANTA